jgi:DNA-directed RNA polymerase subunit RPC12/RpoP
MTQPTFSVVGLPRVARGIRCPYCRHDILAICRKPVYHDIGHTCAACLGTFVIRFDVEVKATVLHVVGEADRVADEQAELLELQESRRLAEEP